MWFLAELVNSAVSAKFRAIRLALALSVSVYIRPDLILMAIAIPVIYFYISAKKFQALKMLVAVAILTSIPVGAWIVRNIQLGNEPLSMLEGVGPHPLGYRAWVNSWVVHEHERDNAALMDPRRAKFHSSKYLSEVEIEEVRILIETLRTNSDDAVLNQKGVDSKFRDLAEKKVLMDGLLARLDRYAERAVQLLFSPFSIWGLPVGIGVDGASALKAARTGDISALLSLTKERKTSILCRLVAYSYQTIFFILFIFLQYFAWKNLFSSNFSPGVRLSSIVVVIASIVTFFRLAFFVYIGGLESRYLAAVIPWVECSVALFITGQLRDVSDWEPDQS